MQKYTLNSAEVHYQPGSCGKVLMNKLEIADEMQMERIESGLMLLLYEKLLIDNQLPATLTFNLIREWHRQWLGNVYEWAGKLRNANIAKDGFQFASAGRITTLITEFEKQFLSRYPLLPSISRPELVCYLAESHVEFILIHLSGKEMAAYRVCFSMYFRYVPGEDCWITADGMSIKTIISKRFRREFPGVSNL